MLAPTDAIVAERLAVRAALADLSLRVPAGATCALVGPAGAGKTTALRVLATLLRADGGRAQVAGHDVAREAAEVRRRIGLVSRGATGCDALTGRENLERLAFLYGLEPAAARRRAADLVELLGLGALADRPAAGYAPGPRRRLDLAASAVGDPAVVLIDEPVAGLAPDAAGGVWEGIRRLATQGRTVLFATRDADDAAAHAGQVVVIDAGRAVS
jgi:ABC-2 type transport system ATP-binding protein